MATAFKSVTDMANTLVAQLSIVQRLKKCVHDVPMEGIIGPQSVPTVDCHLIGTLSEDGRRILTVLRRLIWERNDLQEDLSEGPASGLQRSQIEGKTSEVAILSRLFCTGIEEHEFPGEFKRLRRASGKQGIPLEIVFCKDWKVCARYLHTAGDGMESLPTFFGLSVETNLEEVGRLNIRKPASVPASML